MQKKTAGGAATAGGVRAMVSAAGDIYAKNGVLGFYTGYVPFLFRIAPHIVRVSSPLFGFFGIIISLSDGFASLMILSIVFIVYRNLDLYWNHYSHHFSHDIFYPL